MPRIGRSNFAYLCAFVLVYVIDPVAFSLQLAGVVKLPFGLAGIVLTIGLVLQNIGRTVNTKISPDALMLFSGYVIVASLAMSGHYFQWGDAWVWTQNTAYYALGVMAGSYFLEKGLNRNLKAIFFVSVACSGVLWLLLSDRIFVSGEIEKLNYLHVSDSVAILSLILLGSMKTMRMKLIALIFGSISLYFIGSRFGLIGFVCAGVAMMLRHASWAQRVVMASILVLGAISLIGYVESLGLDINENRFVRLFLFTENDTSLNARIEDDEFSREVFLASPVVGGGYKFYQVNGEGTYAHNVLSIVYEFGMFGVLFSSVVAFVASRSLFKSFLGGRDEIAIGFFIFLLLACLSKYYLWWGYFFCLGYLRACAKQGRMQALGVSTKC